MSFRKRAQIMGYWLNEPGILEPERVRKAMKDLAHDGYGLVRIMLRNTNFNHRSPEVINAVRIGVEEAHKHGMKMAMDAEPHRDPVGRDYGQSFPEATATRLKKGVTKVVNGTFLFRVRAPDTDAQMPIFDGIEASFARTKDGVKKIDLPLNLSWEVTSYDDRCLEQNYEFGRQLQHGRMCKLTGSVDLPEGTELITYVRVRDIRVTDFWHEGFKAYFDSVLECYKDIPLDGFGWDEPALGGDWTNYRYGTGFKAAFEKMKGYKLVDKLWLLDEPGVTPESLKVRLDYYHVLNEGTARAQENLIAKARSLWGKDLFLGTHHTWQGEGGINDYRAGAVDYFRLNDAMDAGYTDCCWWDMDSVVYAYVLGSSLGRLTPSREIECNTWHAKPTNGQVIYNARLMTLLDITWFNIWYGDDTDTCLYPTHYTWDTTVKATHTHHKYQTRLTGALPVVDVAMWHGWEGVTAVNQPEIAGAQKTFCMNTARLFVERNVPMDFIDSRLIEKASIKDGKMVTDLGAYRIVVLPYAAVLPRKAWDKCVEFAKQGGKLIIVATPVGFDTDGKSLEKDFAKLLDMPEVSLAHYLNALNDSGGLSWGRPPRLDLTYPLRGDKTRLQTDVEGEPSGILSPDGNVLYLTDADPRSRLLEVINSWAKPEVKCFSESIQWRHYRKGDESIVICIARKEQIMRGIVRIGGNDIEIRSGTLAFIREKAGKVEIQGEEIDASLRPSA
jgi:hypothetical protein